MLRMMVLMAGILSIQGCATYRGFPEDKVNQPPEANHDRLYYKITGKSIFKGFSALHEVFRDSTGFRESVKTDTMPEEGYFVDVKVSNAAPSVPAVTFGYVSLATYTILPFWSTRNGNNINYDLYKDGVMLGSYEYEIRRKLFVWLGMLPLVWVNGITYSESDAFSASAYDFFDKADVFFTDGKAPGKS